MELLLAFVSFAGGFEPFAELLREPQRVIRLVEDLKLESGGVSAFAARQVIFSPSTDFDQLRRHAIAHGGEGGLGVERLFLRFTSRGDLVALGRFVVHAAPFEADALNAEIILRIDFEGHHFGVENDLLRRFATCSEPRRLVLDRVKSQHERLARLQAIAILPRHRFLRVGGEFAEARRHLVAGNRLRLAIERSAGQFAARSGFDGGLRAFQHAHRSAAHLNHRLRLVFQIRRQLRANGERRELRSRPRQHGDFLAHIAERELHRGIILLRRQGEHICAVFERALNGRLAFEARFRALRRPARVFVELHRELHRLRERHDELFRQRLDASKGEALDVLPRHRPALCGIPRGVRHAESSGDGKRRRTRERPAPTSMPRLRHRVGKILVLHRLRRLRHGRLHESLAARGIVMPRKLHDAEQLIAEPRKGALQQPRRIFELPLTPHPAMPFERQTEPEHCRTTEHERPAHPRGRLHHAIQHEQHDPRHQQAHETSQNALQNLHDPNATTKVRELGLQDRR